MRRDYELLRAFAEREQWTDETPVPPEVFGPLWPDGEPEAQLVMIALDNLPELTDVERTVLIHHFGLDGHATSLTLAQVGQIVGMDEESVRQIKKKALAKVRRRDEPDDQAQAALRLHFAIPTEMDREEADRIIQEIIIAANELHLAYGGSGLTIADRVRVYEPALVPVGGDE